MTDEQIRRGKDLFNRTQVIMREIKVHKEELIAAKDPVNDDFISELHDAQRRASDCRLHLLDAYPKNIA